MNAQEQISHRDTVMNGVTSTARTCNAKDWHYLPASASCDACGTVRIARSALRGCFVPGIFDFTPLLLEPIHQWIPILFWSR